MASVVQVRPAATASSDFVTPKPSGTIHGVTSDQSDSTFAETTPRDTMVNPFYNCTNTQDPPANHERHRFRIARKAKRDSSTQGKDGYWGGGIGSDNTSIYTATLGTGTTVVTTFSAWVPFSAENAAGSKTVDLTHLVDAGTDFTFWRTTDHYVEIDSRAKPTFAGNVKNKAGVSQIGGTITDTNKPRFTFDDIETDGLAVRSWSLVIRDSGNNIVHVATATGSPPSEIIPPALTSGDYTASFELSSAIRDNDPYAAEIDTISFSVDYSSEFEGTGSVLSELRLHVSAIPRKRGRVGLPASD
jgi:hypothetical protein